MIEKKVTFVYKGKKIKIKVKKISNIFQEAFGLTFTRKKKAQALLFELNKSFAIHSYFVFFPFIAIWLDKNNKVIEIRKVKPFAFHLKPKKPFKKLIEVPINNKYKKLVNKLGF